MTQPDTAPSAGENWTDFFKIGDTFTIKGRNNPARPRELQEFKVTSIEQNSVSYVPVWSKKEKAAIKRSEVNFWKRQRRAAR